MKNLKALSLIFLGVFFSFILRAQVLPSHIDFGGGQVESNPSTPCLTAEDYLTLEKRLNMREQEFIEKGILSIERTNEITLFDWPLQQRVGFEHAFYYDVNNFVDLQNGSGILDYNCGQRSYNGHNGIDYDLWPFWWTMMDADQVEVVAAADGIYLEKDDGNFDKNCDCNGMWNAVYIQHADGSRAYYGHLKKNSLTTKPLGSSISKGEYLGLVGSSGCSSNPHLHFEIRDDNDVIEPYQGECNETTDQSWWLDQPSYREPGLNVLLTHDDAPVIDGFCPEGEEPNLQNSFSPGDILYTAAYYHDQMQNDATEYSIMDPSGSEVYTWSHSSPNTYTRSYWFWSFPIPDDALDGVWIFRANYRDQMVSHFFNISNVSATTDIEDKLVRIYPNPVKNELWVEMNEASDFKLKCLNVEGELLKQKEIQSNNSFTLSVSDLMPGVYLLEIHDLRSHKIRLEKFVKH